MSDELFYDRGEAIERGLCEVAEAIKQLARTRAMELYLRYRATSFTPLARETTETVLKGPACDM